MSHSISGEPVLPAMSRLPRQGSNNTTVARGIALWESLEGKPTDRYINATGIVTLLLQLERKADLPAPTRDEDFLPCGESSSTPRSMSALERNPQVPDPNPLRVLGPSIDWRGIPIGPLTTRMETGLS